MTTHLSSQRKLSAPARREAVAAYLFILPWLLGLLIFTLGPIVAAFYFSLTDFQVVKAPVFIGWQNFQQLFGDRLFWQALKVTCIYVFVSTPLGLVLSFAVALLMNQKVRLVGLWRTIYYLPTLVPVIASTMLWLWIFNPEFGLFNTILRYFGIDGPLWLGHSQWALPSLIIMSLWTVGGPMLIYLAGLQGIPTDLYEAADVDGAGRWAKFWAVTIPMMTPVIFFNLVMNMIAAFQVFVQAFVMTDGGPRYATLFYVLYLYQNAFKFFRMGYASALAWVLFLIILFFTALVIRSSALWVFYEGELKRR
ncbi:MAG: sugar ABC transporter permease [Caldilineaceae bacterium]